MSSMRTTTLLTEVRISSCAVRMYVDVALMATWSSLDSINSALVAASVVAMTVGAAWIIWGGGGCGCCCC